MSTTIADQLQEALVRKGWSIKEAAKASAVDRFFLNRLIRGGDPPRTRSGRHTAEHDARYRRVAEALGLDVDAFIATVQRIQLGDGEVGLIDRYPEFRRLLRTHLPIHNEQDVRKLLWATLEDLASRRGVELAQDVSAALEAVTRSAISAGRHTKTPDYLGLGGSQPPLNRLRTRAKRLCNRIGDALLRIGDIKTSRERVRLAALFYEIAPSTDEEPR